MLTVLENTMLPMDFCDCVPSTERPERALALLEKVGLREEADKLPAALSGGQQQVAAVARALANDPPLIVADEPTGNLDTRSAERILGIFGELASQGKTILIVTHDPSLAQRATRRVLISDGELINPFIAQALPLLPHPQMLAATKGAVLRNFQPGEGIPLAEGGLWIVTRGQAQVLRLERRGPPHPVASLEPGEAFGELDLLPGNSAAWALRCADQAPLEMLWLKSPLLRQLLASSPAQERALSQLAHARIQPVDRRVTRKGWLR
jgi:energy-coupling factor transporter ATP-binding protein EcfA2